MNNKSFFQPNIFSNQREEFKNLELYLLKKYNLRGDENYKQIKDEMVDSDFNKWSLLQQRKYLNYPWERLSSIDIPEEKNIEDEPIN